MEQDWDIGIFSGLRVSSPARDRSSEIGVGPTLETQGQQATNANEDPEPSIDEGAEMHADDRGGAPRAVRRKRDRKRSAHEMTDSAQGLTPEDTPAADTVKGTRGRGSTMRT